MKGELERGKRDGDGKEAYPTRVLALLNDTTGLEGYDTLERGMMLEVGKRRRDLCAELYINNTSEASITTRLGAYGGNDGQLELTPWALSTR